MTANGKSPTGSTTKSSMKTEDVNSGPAFSYCRWVTWAVAIIAVVVGVYYFIPKKHSSSPQSDIKGLVFFRNTISFKFEFSNVPALCLIGVGGEGRAEMLKTHIKSISKTRKLFMIEDYPSTTVENTLKFIEACMKQLDVWEDFTDVYVLDSKGKGWLSEMNKAIELTGMDSANLEFICRSGKKCELLTKHNFKVIGVDDKIQESDFQNI